MYNIIKHKFHEKDNIFFTSDWHIFHNPTSWDVPIWKMRGYESPEEHKEDVIAKVNARVNKHSIIYNLGDGFLNAKDDEVLEFLSRIRCEIRYLWGNHASNMYRLYKQEVEKQYSITGVEVYPLKMGNVTFMGNHLEMFVGNQRIILNHFPLRIWHKNNSKHGSPSIHLSGHSHLSDKGRSPNSPLGKAFDLGWDFKKDIWSCNEVMDVMSTKFVETLDHHDSTTT
jgi:calcineurin-like phosphoesterase family protein